MPRVVRMSTLTRGTWHTQVTGPQLSLLESAMARMERIGERLSTTGTRTFLGRIPVKKPVQCTVLGGQLCVHSATY